MEEEDDENDDDGDNDEQLVTAYTWLPCRFYLISLPRKRDKINTVSFMTNRKFK